MHCRKNRWITVLLLWIYTMLMTHELITAACPAGYFGDNCLYKCHCEFDASCDPATGECFGNCAKGFTGKPMCQIENVAVNKTTDQNGDTKVTSVLVVDGNTIQDGSKYLCTRVVDTKFPFRAQWYVDLGTEYALHGVKVYFRNDLAINSPRREGVQIYVGNSPYDFREINQCYRDELKATGIMAPPDVLNLNNCTKRGRYVIVYNNRPIVDPLNCPTATYSCWANLEICEVEVYSCTNGTYGENCDNFCHCKNHTCDQQTGQCPSGGCWDGWLGDKCDTACQDGTYGPNCSRSCAKCFNGDACNTITGVCPRGCKEGWTGSTCEAPCPKFSYGQNCTGICTNCKGGRDCDKATGFCSNGCLKDWYGVRCDERCPQGSYGPECKEKCGFCADADQCNFSNGTCPNGCMPGYLMPMCTEKCSSGFHGDECKQKCGFCDERICHHVTGFCASSCEPGWTGDTCRTPCKAGRFGESCSRSCDHCLNKVCNHVTGLCEKGCEVGWHQPRCDKQCPFASFGEKCAGVCGNCQGNETCHHVTGICSNGCKGGWNGTDCKSVCSEGSYGTRCQLTCGGCVNGTHCHHETGVCKSGCRTGYHGSKCVRSTIDDDGDIIKNAVVGGSMALVIVAAIIIFMCLVKQGKKKNTDKTESEHTRDANANEERFYENANANNAFVVEEPGFVDESDAHRMSIGSNSSLYANNTYYNVQPRPLPGIAVDDLAQCVYDMERDYERYRTEFEELRACPSYPHTAGQKKENKCKNRFLTTFPYDHSRVVLEETDGVEGSDYINANYVDGVDSIRSYIATQGPNKNTVSDFWRMIWQEKVERIVMLANVIEDGKIKCECYWPAHGPVSVSNLVISHENSVEMAKYTIRTFVVTELQTMDSRRVMQYHFTGWPDHGVPDTLELVTFFNRFLEGQVGCSSKLVVHCSAGVGRTGTFIGLHALYTGGIKHGRVDIPDFAKRMRENRMTMIQNIDQYRLLYHALLEAFNYRHSSIRKSQFIQKYQQMMSKDSNTLQEEFNLLQSTKPHYTDHEFAASLYQDNISKNREMSILAVEQFRPYLNTHVHGTNDYINAVIVPSCKVQSRVIVTQCPLPNTVVDFWRLVVDHDCYTIVSLNALDDDPEETGAWWPSEGESVVYGPMTIKTTAVHDLRRGVTEKTFSISRKGLKDKRVVKSFHLAGWAADSNIPSSVDKFLDLVDVTENWKQKCGSDIVAVQCLDGATCSGIYCAVSLVLDRLRLESEVDIYHTLQRMLTRRPEFICSLEQYYFVYDVIAEYVDTRGIYGNL